MTRVAKDIQWLRTGRKKRAGAASRDITPRNADATEIGHVMREIRPFASGQSTWPKGSWDDFFAFVLPATSFLQVDIIGQLYGPDILLICSFPFLMSIRSSMLAQKKIKTVFVLLAFWFLGAVITDVVRETPPEDIARGWSKILVFAINLAAAYLLIANKFNRIVLYLAGIAVGSLLTAQLNPSIYAGDEPWKFGYGFGVTLIAIVAAESRVARQLFGRGITFFLVLSVGVVNLTENYRSMFGIVVAAGAFGALKWFLDSGNSKGNMTLGTFATICLIGVISAQGIIEIYSWVASSGVLGLEAKDKYEAQNTDSLGVLLGGRAELLVSSTAILDTPLIGHGSWARDSTYTAQLVDILEKSGATILYDPFATDLIPSHSHLFGAWVEAGALGGLFWLWILWLWVLAVKAALNVHTNRPVLIAFALFSFMWDILFSPFAANERFVDNVKICLIIWLLETMSRDRRKAGLVTKDAR